MSCGAAFGLVKDRGGVQSDFIPSFVHRESTSNIYSHIQVRNNTVEQHKQQRQATQCDTHRKQHFLFLVPSRNNQLLKHVVWKVKSDRVSKSHTLQILHFSFSEEIKVTLSESHTLNILHFPRSWKVLFRKWKTKNKGALRSRVFVKWQKRYR